MAQVKRKPGRPPKKHPGGRPPVVTDSVLQKLEQAFSFGATDREACLFAGIAEKTLYNYCSDNPNFLQRKEILKQTPALKAKNGLVSNLNEDNPKLCLDVLERIRPQEFSKQTNVNVSGNIQFDTLSDQQIIQRITAISERLGMPVPGQISSDVIDAEIVSQDNS
jgi:hypothetical protein